MITDHRTFDAIVVGSGASGGFAAKTLTEEGLEVLLVEAGDIIHEETDFPVPSPYSAMATTKDRIRAALAGQHIQARCTSFSPKTRHLFVNDRMNPYTTPKQSPFLWFRTRKLGGRLHLWGRNVMRWSDLYFKAADHDGCGFNWPISYNDLEPYYSEVEDFLGIYGTPDGVPHIPDSRYIGPNSLTQSEERMAGILRQKWPGRYVIPARIVKHRRNRIPLPILSAQKTGRLSILPNAAVSRVLTDSASGNATGITYIDTKTKTQKNAYGSVIVLCASPIESVRILLNSASAKHQTGLGNSSGVLGHYLMDHCPFLFFGPTGTGQVQKSEDADHDPWDMATDSGFFIPRFTNVTKPHPDFKRGYNIHGGIDRSPNFWWMFAYGQMIPAFENQVRLHPRKKDAWGIPAAHIQCKRSGNDLRMAEDLKSTVKQIMAETGLTLLEESEPHRKWAQSSPIQFRIYNALLKKLFFEPHVMFPGAGIHELGGARMGNDPQNSVLNSFNQLWDAKNVFVTDGACFPSSGEHQTLTTMALTVRACRYLADEYRHNRLK